MSVEFISGKDHYEKVVARVASVRKSLWIGTADIKDVSVKDGSGTKPFLGVLAYLLKRGVECFVGALRKSQNPSTTMS